MQSLRGELGDVDRLGVWIASEGQIAAAPQAFQGRCWDLTARVGGEEYRPEWSDLGEAGPLPEALLRRLEPVEKEISIESGVSLAVASGMRRVLWMPVAEEKQLVGVLFAGSRNKAAALPCEGLTRVAAELVVGLGFQRGDVRIQSGLAERIFQRKILQEISGEFSLDRVLQEIVDAVVSFGAGRKTVGAFAMIGLPPARSLAGVTSDSALEFLWTAGDRLWARSAMGEPISPVWKEALAERRTTGGETQASWPPPETMRLIATPLLVRGSAAGVLVAGLQHSRATLATLEEFEALARLASLTVELSQPNARGESSGESARFFLDHAGNAGFLLNAKLEVTHASASGKKLLPLASTPAAKNGRDVPPGKAGTLGTAAQLFRPAEWQRLVEWIRSVSRKSEVGVSYSTEAELRTGRQVQLSAASLAGGHTGLLIQKPAAFEAEADWGGAELQNLMEWLDEGVVIFGEREEIRAANPAFWQLLGLSTVEIDRASALRELVDFIAPRMDDPERFAQRWWDIARGFDAGAREEIELKQPTARFLERFSRPILNPVGTRIGRVEIYRDITSQRVFQSKLRKNERLVSLGEKMGGIAHELSNPLTTILGYAQRLLAKGEPAASREQIQRIFFEAERASSILRQMLGSVSESAPELRPISLNQLVQRTVDMHRFQLRSEKIRVDVDLADTLPQIAGDAGQLQQVLVNLIANSRHALMELQLPGVISIRTGLSASGRVLLEVSDTGPGIPEALRHRIFDPFFTTKPSGAGTGLGLPIVADLVRKHGGHIRQDQAGGKGTTFVMDFPAALAREATPLSELAPALSAPYGAASGERVLIVEDEQTVAQLIADMLADVGYSCEIQNDARRALISALSRDYDLVICDIKMPGLDGPHLYRALAEAGSALISRFLFVTGDVLGAVTKSFLQENRLPYIAKPFRVEEFTEKIARVAQGVASSTGTGDHNPSFSRKNVAGHG